MATRIIEMGTAEPHCPPPVRRRSTSPELVLTNARIVTADEIVGGTVIVRGGEIAGVDRRPTRVSGAVDFAGDYLLPGLVELHTDNLEKHVAPRPGVRWPMPAAVLAHDAQIAGAGITTVFDALTVGEVRHDGVRAEMLHSSIEAIAAGQREGGLAGMELKINSRIRSSN